MIKKALAVMLSALGLTACTQQNKVQEPEPPCALILCYSQTGATRSVAENLQELTGADIEFIELEDPYDGTFEETIARCQQEKAEGKLPVLKPLKSDLTQYDVIYLGFPVWFGTYATPIASLVKDNDFEGSHIVTFCTFGSGGLQSSTADLKAALPKAEVTEGYGVRNARVSAAADELPRFLIEGGYIDGDIEPLDDFSEQVPVSEGDTALFNAACGNYQFPLGTPVTVGSRATPDGTEYKFIVSSFNPDGTESSSAIYVILKEGAEPEFTQVVR